MRSLFKTRCAPVLKLLAVGTLAFASSACGSSLSSASSVDDIEFIEPGDSDLASASMVPDGCSSRSGDCMPPQSWANKLCQGVHPEVALHMFRGGTPWTRLYSRANAPAYNGAGGPSLSDEQVTVHEELIALRRHTDGRAGSAGEMTVGDTAGYDALRWNGSCVTMHDGEFIKQPPRLTKYARVEWRWLGDETRSALRKSGLVRRAYSARRKECKGATLGSVTSECVKRDQHLVAAIVHYVRSGGELPEPSESL